MTKPRAARLTAFGGGAFRGTVAWASTSRVPERSRARPKSIARRSHRQFTEQLHLLHPINLQAQTWTHSTLQSILIVVGIHSPTPTYFARVSWAVCMRTFELMLILLGTRHCTAHRTQRPWQGAQESGDGPALPQFDDACYLCPGNKRATGGLNDMYEGTFVSS